VNWPSTLQIYSCPLNISQKGLTIASLIRNSEGEDVAEVGAVTLNFNYNSKKVERIPQTIVDCFIEMDKHQLSSVTKRLQNAFSSII
jgi:acyl CoA:acetate/3-ketoacid CoA transferase